jgi:hypothetical protein
LCHLINRRGQAPRFLFKSPEKKRKKQIKQEMALEGQRSTRTIVQEASLLEGRNFEIK